MAEDLIIKISGDISEFKDKLDELSEKTEHMNDGLKTMAAGAGVAFAALSAIIGVTAAKYGEQEKATKSLTLALQNQGIFSQDLLQSYEDQASAISDLTGIDDEAIATGQAKLQSMIGQREISMELTKAMADLSTQTGSVSGAAEILGRGIEGNARVLKQFGIVIDDNLDKNQRMAAIIQAVTQKFGGQAEAMNQGLGGVKGLKTAFEDFEKVIGEKFAPIISDAIKFMTDFFKSLKDNQPLVDFLAWAIGIAAAITGVIVAVTGAGLAIGKIISVVQLATAAFGAMGISIGALVGATGIGLLLFIGYELYKNWSVIWPKMQQIFAIFAENIGMVGKGLGGILIGAFTFNKEKILQGWEDLKNGLAKIVSDTYKTLKPIPPPKFDMEEAQKQDLQKKALADKQNAAEVAREQNKLALQKATRELQFLEATGATQDIIDLKKNEVQVLKDLEVEHDAKMVASLKERLDLIKFLEKEAFNDSIEQANIYYEDAILKNKEYQELSSAEQLEFINKNQKALQSSVETESSTRKKAALNRAKMEIESHNQLLADQQKYGKAYALLNQMMHSEIYQGSKQAFGNLAELQSSSNATLKQIGKVAAIANIIIKTAESAMAIYAGFSTIPIVGPALGVAGAAAAIAFGAEQVGRVTGAAEGGLITGGIPGIDSVPVLAQQGELIAPKQNFDEVVNSVAASRAGNNLGNQGGVGVVISMDGKEAERVLTARQNEAKKLGIYTGTS